MRILGIDPGLNVTGYGVVDLERSGIRLIEAGVVRTNGQATIEQRLGEIASELEAIITQFQPEALAVEDLYSHYAHPRTAIVMGHARGIVLLKAAESGLPVHQYSATRIKKALTGNGRATKQQVQRMIKTILTLSAVPEPPDAADAMATALCHCRTLVRTMSVTT